MIENKWEKARIKSCDKIGEECNNSNRAGISINDPEER